MLGQAHAMLDSMFRLPAGRKHPTFPRKRTAKFLASGLTFFSPFPSLSHTFSISPPFKKRLRFRPTAHPPIANQLPITRTFFFPLIKLRPPWLVPGRAFRRAGSSALQALQPCLVGPLTNTPLGASLPLLGAHPLWTWELPRQEKKKNRLEKALLAPSSSSSTLASRFRTKALRLVADIPSLSPSFFFCSATRSGHFLSLPVLL
ncbi:hypothetical protein IF1G_05518 [Cordyceps javanica]|uniref:Uncharacterized protein n=1 Tax=Cordyceps javanica TaxID=43265 RepID=A0A545V1V2_9HYPO|nr:hypothetical protein IF1G_05518 [Cordyceps javanica]